MLQIRLAYVAKHAQHRQHVVDSHRAVAVEVGRAIGCAAKLAQHHQHVADANGAVAREVGRGNLRPWDRRWARWGGRRGCARDKRHPGVGAVGGSAVAGVGDLERVPRHVVNAAPPKRVPDCQDQIVGQRVHFERGVKWSFFRVVVQPNHAVIPGSTTKAGKA